MDARQFITGKSLVEPPVGTEPPDWRPASEDLLVAPGAGAGSGNERTNPSLSEQLAFGQAQGLLVGLTGCTPRRAGKALMEAAARLELHPASLATMFLHCATTVQDDESEAFVVSLGDAALAADPDDESPADHADPGPPLADRAAAAPDPEPGGTGGGRYPPPVLEVTPFPAGGHGGVTVHGELDLMTSPLLEAAVTEVYRTAAAPRDAATAGVFLLNLADMTFLDGSGLQALQSVHGRTQGRGDELRVAAPVAGGPRRLLRFAVSRGWLAPLFTPVSGPPGPADLG